MKNLDTEKKSGIPKNKSRSRSQGFRDFRDFEIPIPFPGISGFFDLAQIKKSQSGFTIPKKSHPGANSGKL